MQEPLSPLSNIYTQISSKQWPEALASAEQHLAAQPAIADAHYAKAFILDKLGRRKKAEQAILLAIEQNPYKADYYALLAFFYQQRRRSEHAHYVANYGLSLQPEHATCLSLRALALVSLFRLEEAHGAIQQLRAVRQTTQPAQPNEHVLPIVHDDVEVLFERALEIDPFRTKTRKECFDTIKNKMSLGRLAHTILPEGRAKTIFGLFIIGAIITAITYFFRDQATYRSFSPLVLVILIVLWTRTAISFGANLPMLFTKPYRRFIQAYDIKLAVQVWILLIISLTAFLCWHEFKSFTGLTFAIIFAIGVQSREEKFASGRDASGLTIPAPRKPKEKKAKTAPAWQHVDYADASYNLLYQVLRTMPPFIKFGIKINTFLVQKASLAIVLWPIIFGILKVSDVVQNYNYLLWPMLALLFYMQCFLIWYPVADLPLLHPRAARKFIPTRRRNHALKMLLLQMLSMATLVGWLVLHDDRVLWLSLAVFLIIVQQSIFLKNNRVQVSTEEYDNNEPLRQALIAYVQERMRTDGAGKTITKSEAAGSGSQIPGE